MIYGISNWLNPDPTHFGLTDESISNFGQNHDMFSYFTYQKISL